MDQMKQKNLERLIDIYRDIHEDLLSFEGKDVVNFILTKEIKRLNDELKHPKIEGMFWCANCEAMFAYHNK